MKWLMRHAFICAQCRADVDLFLNKCLIPAKLSVCCTHFLVSIQTRVGRLRSVSHQLANLKCHVWSFNNNNLKNYRDNFWTCFSWFCVLGMPRLAPGCWPVYRVSVWCLPEVPAPVQHNIFILGGDGGEKQKSK